MTRRAADPTLESLRAELAAAARVIDEQARTIAALRADRAALHATTAWLTEQADDLWRENRALHTAAGGATPCPVARYALRLHADPAAPPTVITHRTREAA